VWDLLAANLFADQKKVARSTRSPKS